MEVSRITFSQAKKKKVPNSKFPEDDNRRMGIPQLKNPPRKIKYRTFARPSLTKALENNLRSASHTKAPDS